MLDKEYVEERGILVAEELLNRVLATDKEAGYVFFEENLLPPGTREGPTAGIEPGMRGLRVAADKIRGLHGLRRGDRFDLVANRAVDSNKTRDAIGQVAPLVRAMQAENDAWETSTRVIVQNGRSSSRSRRARLRAVERRASRRSSSPSAKPRSRP